MKRRGPDEKPRRRWSDADNDAMRRLIGAGMSRRDVANILQRSEGAVRIQANKLGLHFDEEARRERMKASAKRNWKDPAYRAKVAAGVSASFTPERRAALSERCTRLKLWEGGQAVLNSDQQAALRRAVAARATILKLHQQRLAWCPPDYLPAYRQLSKRMPAAEAKAQILARIEADAERELMAEAARHDWPASFVDLLRRTRAGTVEIVERAAIVRPDHVHPLLEGQAA